METKKTSSFTCHSKSFISIFFTCQVSACDLQPFSCHDLANDVHSQTDKTVFSHLKWLMLLQLVLDNSWPATSKTSLDFVFFKIWKSSGFLCFLTLYILAKLLGNKRGHGLWLVDFNPFCVFQSFRVRCFVFEKHRKFYLSSQFFVFFILKHGKFRFQGEVVPIELPNPEETQIRKGENEPVCSR